EPVELGVEVGHRPLQLGDVAGELVLVIVVVADPVDGVVDEVLGLVDDRLPPVEDVLALRLLLLRHRAPPSIQHLMKRSSTYVEHPGGSSPRVSRWPLPSPE